MVDTVQNKDRLFIVGASHLARELESWINLIPEEKKDWKFVGFLHNTKNGNPLEGFPSDYNILGDWESYSFQKGDRCIIGVADVEWREKIYNTLKDKVWFMPFVAHNSIIGKFSEISDGTVICPFCTISTNVKIGKACLFNSGTQIGHDVEISDFCSVMANVDLGGFVKLDNKVFIGTKSTILPKRKIASNVVVGAGSVVIRNIKKKSVVVFGNPAKEI
jgi:sugar O-acyltransferase (sialic acid O-acetyltransferase NeuD family)